MMKKAIIIHGAYGNPDENWFPWLAKELEKIRYEVRRPEFPTPENQNLITWISKLEEVWQPNEDTILIGHSIGAAFVLRVLMQHNGVPVKAAFLVSGFVSQLGNPEFDELNASFLEEPFNWGVIKKNCQDFYVYHSDNDPYVLLEKAEELAGNLGVEVKLVSGAGHFNEAAGYTQFEKILEDIKIYE